MMCKRAIAPVRLLYREPSDGEISRHIACAISRISFNEEGRTSLIAAGACGALEDARHFAVDGKTCIVHVLAALQPGRQSKKSKLSHIWRFVTITSWCAMK